MITRSQLKRLRNRVFRAGARVGIPLAKGIGLQVRPEGHFPCVLEWSKSKDRGPRESFEEYEAPAKREREVSERLLDSPLGDCFRAVEPGSTTRQFRLALQDARVYGARGVIVHRSNRIFSELTFEYATEPRHFSFWNDVRIAPLGGRHRSIGVAHSMSADNYSHWLLEVVPQLARLKCDLDAGEIEAIYVRRKLEFQREWLKLMAIDPDKVIEADDLKHLEAGKLVVYSMPMRNGEFSRKQLDDFRAFADPSWKRIPGRKLFVGREGGNRPFRLSDAQLSEVVEECGYEYVLMERHPVKEKIRMFAEASVIAGPHGGGFGGIVFSEAGAQLREIHSPLVPNLCYWRIADSHSMYYDAVFADVAEDDGAEPARKGVQKALHMTGNKMRDFLCREISS